MRLLVLAAALLAVPLAAAAIGDKTAVPLRPTELTAADLDRDRDVDIAVVGPCRGKRTTCLAGIENVRKLLGTVRNVELRGFTLAGASVAQVGNGLVIAGNGGAGPDIAFLRTAGHGSFTLGQRFQLPGGATDVAAGDVNGDGRVDIVTAGPAGIAVLPGRAGGFGEPVVTATPFRPLDVTVERLDRDAFGDVAFVGGNRLGVLEAGRDFAFGSPDLEALRATAVGVDGAGGGVDATPDLVVATTRGIQVFTTVSDPAGGVDPVGGTFLPGARPVGVVLADVTRDNLVDIIALNAGSGNVSTNVASAGGGYGSAIRSVPIGANPVSLSLINFDNDGIPDVVVANASAVGGGTVTVLQGNGLGAFRTGPPPPTAGAIPVVFSLAWNHPSPNQGFSWVCANITAASGALLTLTLTTPEGQTIVGTLQLKRKETKTAPGTFSFKITSPGRYALRIDARAPDGKRSTASKSIDVTGAPGSATCGP
jgi:hypothetical protein